MVDRRSSHENNKRLREQLEGIKEGDEVSLEPPTKKIKLDTGIPPGNQAEERSEEMDVVKPSTMSDFAQRMMKKMGHKEGEGIEALFFLSNTISARRKRRCHKGAN